MPVAPPHSCTQVGCSATVPAGAGGRCPAHARPSANQRGYTSRWKIYRKAYLAANPLCVICAVSGPPGGNGKPAVRASSVVDHKVAHRGDDRLFWDPTNHRAICRPHHDARVDEGDFGRDAPVIR